MRTRSLARVVQWADMQLAQYEGMADHLSPPMSGADMDVARFLAIESANTWAGFMRAYFLASATRAWLADGSRVSGPGTVKRVEAAVTSAVHYFQPHLTAQQGPWSYADEPNWLDPAIVSRLLHGLGLSNAQGFTNALGAGTRANERLSTFRNFVAHRDRGTALKVRRLIESLGIAATGDPMELPFHPIPHRPVSAFSAWVVELRSITQLCPF